MTSELIDQIAEIRELQADQQRKLDVLGYESSPEAIAEIASSKVRPVMADLRDSNNRISNLKKDMMEQKNFVRKIVDDLEQKLHIELKNFALDNDSDGEDETPFQMQLKELVRKQSKDVVEEEIGGMLMPQVNEDGDSDEKSTKLKNRSSFSGLALGANMMGEIEEIIDRKLSEKGVIVAMLSVKDLTEKFSRHEANMTELRELLEHQQKGLVQMTDKIGNHKTVINMEQENLREDLAKEQKRISYTIEEHDKLNKECQRQFPILNSRININETRRHEMEREIMTITDRLPPNVEVLLKTVQLV